MSSNSKEVEMNVEKLSYVTYSKIEELAEMIKMIESELSEPYSIFTYRYFLQKWPELCLLTYYDNEIVGCIIGKLDNHREKMRGYIAMLVVVKKYRKLGIGKKLVELFVEKVKEMKGDEIVLETEAINKAAISLYTRFAKDKRLLNYYMSGNDAFRFKLWIKKIEKNKIELKENKENKQIEQN